MAATELEGALRQRDFVEASAPELAHVLQLWRGRATWRPEAQAGLLAGPMETSTRTATPRWTARPSAPANFPPVASWSKM